MVKNMVLFRCTGCGEICIPQSDEVLNGSDDLYRCPACGREWENPGYDEKHGICMNPGFEPVEGEAI